MTDVSDGRAALKVVYESPPDLVVTDVMMPVIDGVELIRRLRSDPAMARIPILAVSGDAHLADSADAIVPKPYPWQRLIAVADALLKEGHGLNGSG